ncbi:hypothetical protein N7452_002370 [Penicillium brevicompactum]|uniref:Uncharacterized protein n=1 Tax=Penicillium brevicompactum TaxID=5074 RepID=A0A9W9USR2_PENBR|nr:hypothetical protein N7452_002370 [Penicillium brevicompactum]
MASSLDSNIKLDQAPAQAVRNPSNALNGIACVAGSQGFFKEPLHVSSPPGHLFDSDSVSEGSSEGSRISETPIHVDPTSRLNHLASLIEHAECELGSLHLVPSGFVEEGADRPKFDGNTVMADPEPFSESSQNAACAFLRERMVIAKSRVSKLSRIIEKLELQRQAARSELADAEVVINLLEKNC